jgi:hypothetical protein
MTVKVQVEYTMRVSQECHGISLAAATPAAPVRLREYRRVETSRSLRDAMIVYGQGNLASLGHTTASGHLFGTVLRELER